jgi:medium-chain acyl-[acyl-carrier-protein] hydrolase
VGARAPATRAMMPAAMHRFVTRFTVHTYEVDAFQSLALPALAGYLEDAASQHAAQLGWGLAALQERGLTWVMVRQRIDVLAPVQLRDELEVATWPSGIDRRSAIREFSVARPGGAEVARATTHWFVLDLATRRVVRPDEVLPAEHWPRLEPHSSALARLPELSAGPPGRRLDVRYSDIDRNLHANHASYLSWALECVPEATWRASRPCSIEATYLAECRYGDTLLGRATEEDGAWLHALSREADGKELARLRTSWSRRGAQPERRAR